MKLIKYSIILIFTCMLALACKKECYRDLTSAELQGLVYTGAETLTFRYSGNGELYTTTTKKKEEERMEQGKRCRDSRYRHARVFSLTTNNQDSSYALRHGFQISLTDPDVKDKSFKYPEISFYGTYNFSNSPKVSLNINNQLFNDVYKLESINLLKIQRIYYSYQYGLLRIDLLDGTYWERINY